MSDGQAAAGDLPAAAPVQPPLHELDCRQQGRVLTWLGVVLVIFALAEVGILVAAVHSQDGAGLNSVREDAKSFCLYILGVLSGVLGPQAVRRGP